MKTELNRRDAETRRQYSFVAMSGGSKRGCDFWPERFCTSKLRIRAVSLLLFRKWFGGRCPDVELSWHKDGFMAEARDRSGRQLQVTQHNSASPRLRGESKS